MNNNDISGVKLIKAQLDEIQKTVKLFFDEDHSDIITVKIKDLRISIAQALFDSISGNNHDQIDDNPKIEENSAPVSGTQDEWVNIFKENPKSENELMWRYFARISKLTNRNRHTVTSKYYDLVHKKSVRTKKDWVGLFKNNPKEVDESMPHYFDRLSDIIGYSKNTVKSKYYLLKRKVHKPSLPPEFMRLRASKSHMARACNVTLKTFRKKVKEGIHSGSIALKSSDFLKYRFFIGIDVFIIMRYFFKNTSDEVIFNILKLHSKK